jgi:hypothetical protein
VELDDGRVSGVVSVKEVYDMVNDEKALSGGAGATFVQRTWVGYRPGLLNSDLTKSSNTFNVCVSLVYQQLNLTQNN